MLKKIMCIISTLIILISIFILPVSAAEFTETTTFINNWNALDWKAHFGDDINVTKYTDTVMAKLEELSKNEKQFVWIKNYSEMFSYECDDDGIDIFSPDVSAPGFSFRTSASKVYSYTYFYPTTTSYYSSTTAHMPFVPYSADEIYILSDYDEYIEAVNSGVFSDCSNIYYCENPFQSLIDYIKMGDADFNKIEPPKGFNNSVIKYAYCFDNPYNNYGFKPYENDFENYLTAGLFSDLNIYYDSYFNIDSLHEHSETINFYVDITDSKGNLVEDYHEHFSSHMQDYLTDGNIPEEELSSFINAHFRAVHFERDSYTVLDYFNPGYGDYDYSAFNEFISIKMIDKKYYLKFTLGSDYTFAGNIFSGFRITHTCTHINPDTGDIGGSGNGLGSDMSQADDTVSRPPTKDELRDMGFDYGYPNTNGSFPYKLTIYRNGVEYFQMYFSKMPFVSSTYYSDKCIDYGVNVSNMKVYMYFKEQNMSKQFDFTNNNDDIYNSGMVQSGSSYDNLIFKPLDELTSRLLNSLLRVNVSEFNNTFTLHFWTNYSGSFENMSGFYCKFNWDLQNSGRFQKNNSDDDYDYTQDYKPEDSFTDNNGNIHGGAVDAPTESPDYNGFNNEDFSFDENNLWKYADSFLGFCARAFKVLPSFIWQLIGCSIVIVIVLRIVGR